MKNELIHQYITLPLAINVFRRDRNTFAHFKFGNVYQAKIDSCIDQLKNDFYNLKQEMYTKHHIDLKYLGKNKNEVRYKMNREILIFSPNELRQMTRDVMRSYLYGNKAVPFEVGNRPWTI